MLKHLILISLFIFLMAGPVLSQTGESKTEVIAAQYIYVPGGAGGQELHLVPKVGTSIDAELQKFLTKDVVYQLELISLSNTSTTTPQDVSTFFGLKEPDSVSSPQSKTLKINIQVLKPLPAGYYVLKMPGLQKYTANPYEFVVFEVGEAPAQPTLKATIEAPIDGSRDKIRVKSDSQNRTFKTEARPLVEVEKFKLNSDNKSIERSTVEIKAQTLNVEGKPVDGVTVSDEVTLKLNKKLPRSQQSNLRIKCGINTACPTAEPPPKEPLIEGKIAAIELPKDADQVTADVSISYTAATGTGPSLDVSAKYNAQEKYPVKGWFFQPQGELALALGKSEEESSIVVDLPFRKTIMAGRLTRFALTDKAFAGKDLTDDVSKKKKTTTIVPNYYGWTQTPVEKGKFYFYVGPKFEMNRNFDRINLLGSTRLEFRSYRLMASISQKRQYLTGSTYGVSKEVAQQVAINNGNSFVPFAAFDFGGSLSEQTIEVEERGISERIRRYPVARIYSGFTNTLETTLLGLPVNLKIEENVYYFLTEERFGGTREGLLGDSVVKVIDIRKVKGWQHFGSFTLDFFFSPLRRYSLNITYENGRKAPNLDYLNKVTAGFKVRY